MKKKINKILEVSSFIRIDDYKVMNRKYVCAVVIEKFGYVGNLYSIDFITKGAIYIIFKTKGKTATRKKVKYLLGDDFNDFIMVNNKEKEIYVNKNKIKEMKIFEDTETGNKVIILQVEGGHSYNSKLFKNINEINEWLRKNFRYKEVKNEKAV